MGESAVALKFVPAAKALQRFPKWYDDLPNVRDAHGMRRELYKQPDIQKLPSIGYQWAVVALWHRDLKAATNGLTTGDDITHACGVRFRLIKPVIDEWAKKITLHAFLTPSKFDQSVYDWYQNLPHGDQVVPPIGIEQSYMNHRSVWFWDDKDGLPRELHDSGRVVFYLEYIAGVQDPKAFYEPVVLPGKLSFQEAKDKMQIWLRNIPYGVFV